MNMNSMYRKAGKQLLNLISKQNVQHIIDLLHFPKRSSSHTANLPYRIRQMETKDLGFVCKMLQDEAWIMEKPVLECAYKTDPKGFFVAETDDGEIIGSHGYLAHEKKLASTGMWMVKNGYRNSSVGIKLYEKMKRQIGNINTSGFIWPHFFTKAQNYSEHRIKTGMMTWYNQGTVRESAFRSKPQEENLNLLPVSKISFSDLVEYDTSVHKLKREHYLKNWVQFEGFFSLVAVQNNNICGYGVLGLQDGKYFIAPLYADSDSIAEELFHGLASKVPVGSNLGFANPLDNFFATDLATEQGMYQPGKPLVTIYDKELVDIDTKRVYAVSSLSFGTC